jgi:hypothetical protein
MLPAFPKIEKWCGELGSQLIERLAAQHAPLLGLIDKHIQFEGGGSRIHRHDDSEGDTPLQRITAEVSFPRRLPLNDLPNELPKHAQALAEQIAAAASKLFYEQLAEATAEAGTTIDAQGKPFSEKMILSLLAKMDHSFAPDGTWEAPTLVTSPEMVERLMRSAGPDGSGSLEFNEALGKLLEQKRDEFRRREADRILAG